MLRTTTISEPLALWSRRFGLFALALLGVGLVLHRFGQLATGVFLIVSSAALGFAAFAIVCGVLAGISIWIRGRMGAGRMAVGISAGSLLWLLPLAYLPAYLGLPAVNDITTDAVNPPNFAMLGQVRGPGANSAAYAGERSARLQANAYPDLRTLVVDRSADEVFDLAVLVVRGRKGMGWKVLAEDPPSARPPKPGVIEATERTAIVGFIDDISIRVTGSDREARVDVRSASRFGRHDFGVNASRIRRFLRELQSRLEATQPGMAAARATRAARAQLGPHGSKPGLKQPLSRLQGSKAGKAGQDPARSDARRGPVPKVPPRG